MKVGWIAITIVLALALTPRALADEGSGRAEKLRIEVMVIEASSTGEPYVDRKLRGIASHLTKVLRFKRYVLARKPLRQNAKTGEKRVFVLPGPMSAEITIASYNETKGTYTLDVVLFRKPVRQAAGGGSGQSATPRRVVVLKTRIAKAPGSPAFIVCPRARTVTHILAIMVN